MSEQGAPFGFRRNTHGPDGEFRNDIPMWAAKVVENSEAGFVIHMLDPRRPMSRHELGQEIAEYDAQNIDTARTRNVDAALVTLLETGMAKVEAIPSDDWRFTPSAESAAVVFLEDVESERDAALSLIRRMAERFDGARNGKCTVCGAGRLTDAWHELAGKLSPPFACPNRNCLSYDIRSVLLNAER
jgi:hypothetical protein